MVMENEIKVTHFIPPNIEDFYIDAKEARRISRATSKNAMLSIMEEIRTQAGKGSDYIFLPTQPSEGDMKRLYSMGYTYHSLKTATDLYITIIAW